MIGLSFSHVKYVIKNVGTLDYMGMREHLYNFHYFTNIKMVFPNIVSFLLPIDNTEKFEGYFHPRVLEDSEYTAKEFE